MNAPKTQTGTLGAPPTGQAFWDAGAGQTMAPDHEFSELVQVDTSKRSGSRGVLYLLLFLIMAVVGWFAFETFVAERDPLATLQGYFDLLAGNQSEDEPLDEPPPQPRKQAKA